MIALFICAFVGHGDKRVSGTTVQYTDCWGTDCWGTSVAVVLEDEGEFCPGLVPDIQDDFWVKRHTFGPDVGNGCSIA